MTIKGISIILYTRTKTGTDDFNRPIYLESQVQVDNVVVGQPTSDDITSEINLSGKTISYTLAIPADDTHDWENAVVEFFGKKWRTVGIPQQFMDGFMGADFPWNKKVRVERYE